MFTRHVDFVALRMRAFVPSSPGASLKRPGFDSPGTVLPSFHDACLMNRFRDPYGAEIMIRIFLGYRDPYGVIVI